MRFVILLTGFPLLLICAHVQAQSKDQPKPDERLNYRAVIHAALAKDKSIIESIDNLPDYNDVAWVSSMVNSGREPAPISYWYERVFVPRVNRVRKILEEVEQKPELREQAAKRLVEKLQWSVQEFESSHQQRLKDAKAVLTEPDAYDRCMVYGPACVYFYCVCHDRWLNRRGGKRLRRRQ